MALGTASVVVGSQFETSFAKVSTLFGDTKVNTDGLKDKILELSNATGLSANELNEGLYSALSAGIPVTEDMTEAMEFLRVSTDLARGGFTTTEGAVDVLTTVMNGYKMEAKDAQKVSDILLQTQNKGKTTVDELASSIAQVTPTASAMNVEFEQVAAALATMTAQGIPTSQATTQLNSLFAELGKGGTKVATILKDKTGMSFQDLMLEGYSLSDVLTTLGLDIDDLNTEIMKNYEETGNMNEAIDKVLETSPKTTETLIDMFGSIEAGKAALSMTGQNAESFKSNLDAMYNSAGATKEASDKMNDTLQVQADKLKQAGTNVLIKMYEKLKKPMADVLAFLTDLITNFDKYKPIVVGITAVLGSLASMLTLNALGLIKVTSAGVAWVGVGGLMSTVTTALGVAFAFLKSHTTLIVLGIAALIAIGYLLIDNWSTIQAWASEVWTNITNIFTQFDTFLTNIFTTDWTKSFGIFGEVINAFLKRFSDWWTSVKGIFTGIIDFIKNVFSGNWKGAWQSVVDIFGSVFGLIANVVKAPINLVIGFVNGMIAGVESGINYIIKALNKISFDVPDWVPVIGGEKWGFDMKKVSFDRIPLLERGGILRKGEVGLLEGKGAEAVVPLDRNKYWISAVAKDFAKYMPTQTQNNNSQIINFNQPIETPDQVARTMRLQRNYGLAGGY